MAGVCGNQYTVQVFHHPYHAMKSPFDTDERRAFRETVARFVKQEIEPNADAWDEAGSFPWEVHEQACALGLFGFGIDEQYGGLGFEDAFMRAASAEELGRGGIGGAIAAIGSRGIMVGLVNSLANEAIKRRALPEILSGVKGARSASPSRRAVPMLPACRPARAATAMNTCSTVPRPSSPAA